MIIRNHFTSKTKFGRPPHMRNGLSGHRIHSWRTVNYLESHSLQGYTDLHLLKLNSLLDLMRNVL